jgi:hypothetical protein
MQTMKADSLADLVRMAAKLHLTWKPKSDACVALCA